MIIIYYFLFGQERTLDPKELLKKLPKDFKGYIGLDINIETMPDEVLDQLRKQTRDKANCF